MKKPALPPEETQRLRALHNLRVLDTEPEERFDRITRLARKLFDVPIALVSLVDADRQWFKSRQGLEAAETSREISFCGHAILEDHPFVVADARDDDRFTDNPLVRDDPSIRFYAGHPVHGPDGTRVGTLCVIDREPRQMSSEDVATLIDLASMVDRELNLLTRSSTDELTQISNRRGFSQIARHVLALCVRSGHPAAVVVFDLDGFKRINDTQGHEAGDEVLRQFARLLIKQFRDADVVARLGGDEFCVLASACTPAQAESARARLERAFSASELAASQPDLGWSCGISGFDPASPVEVEDLLREADQRMYADKSRRRRDAGSHG
jgi:diguanylate cyclase (GGDEF)-like protein